MSLSDYRRKRDFRTTPEPKGRLARRKGAGFVIQKHAARRLHYDLRLEMEGVLRSWAVTRGPSLVAGEKRLAVHVEDHPLDYGDFEGVIPTGAYGAGTVLLWDRGSWSVVGDAAKGYAKGHLEFELSGEKLRGRWHLIRMQAKPGESRENWLLIKADDAEARGPEAQDILDELPLSVKSGLDLPEIAGADPIKARKGKARAAKPRPPAEEEEAVPNASALSGAKKRQPPEFIPPMLAKLATKAPTGEGWLHEIKFDGYRIQAHLEAGSVWLMTRSGQDWTQRCGPGIANSLAALPVANAILDGELVVETAAGASDFSALQADLSEGRSDRLVYYAFDLLHLDRYDLRGAALAERKALLETLLAEAGPGLRYSAHFGETGAMVLRHACRLSLEGIVSKKRDAPYRSGRSGAWVKSKCASRQEFVIAGYTSSAAQPESIGSLVLGVFEEDELVHVGRVGTGFSQQMAAELHARLKPLRRKTSPFAKPLTSAQEAGVHFVRPALAAEVEFSAWTAAGQLRHAVFRGLREDKPVTEIIREGPAAPAAASPLQRVRLTNPGRVYWPGAGITKQDLAEYHIAGWRRIAPFITHRPLALLRCPEGIEGPSFFQKHAWKGIRPQVDLVKDPKNPGEPLIAIHDLDGLLALVQSAALEIHPWGSTLEDWERPDTLVMDLDPGEGVAWEAVIAAAFEVRQRLEDAGLAAFVKTSGGKGLHVVAPLTPHARWPEVKAFSKSVAVSMAADAPNLYVATVSKAKRRGRILIDYLRNQRGATAVAPWSPRARPSAPVSVPVFWEELSIVTGPAAFTISTLPGRLESLSGHPWAGYHAAAVPLKVKPGRR